MLEDAAAVARLHILGWQQTYRGLFPDDLLDLPTLEKRTARWQGYLQPESLSATFLALLDNQPAGFCHVSPTRDHLAARYPGEVCSIYILAEAQRRGVGSALLRDGFRWLVTQGMNDAALWVLEANTKACGFYERMGGYVIPGEQQLCNQASPPLPEIAYGWRNLPRHPLLA